MFRRKVQPLDEVLNKLLRDEGLESPLQQRRLLDAWAEVVGVAVDRYTKEKAIRNQTLFVKIQNPALRSDLGMMKTEIMRKLNEKAGAQIITDIRFY
jgi:predicted nucleic acid-binding Zn ribbon protein